MNDERILVSIRQELDAIRWVVDELLSLKADVGDREPDIREKAAAGAFLGQFYLGVENILKRILQYYDVPLQNSSTWHIDLFERFCEPERPPVPVLFRGELEPAVDSFRRFRHVVIHGYGFQLDWNRMSIGIQQLPHVFALFEAAVGTFLADVGNH